MKKVSKGKLDISNKSKSKSGKQITVYFTPGCPWCQKVKQYLKDKNVKYKEIDVSADHAAMDYIIGKTGELGVPQTEINGQFIIGFDKDGIDKALKN